LKLADTRWLAMHQCVVRMLECWNSLTHYFLVAVNEDHLKSAETILESLNNNIVKAYFYFLKYALNLFNSFNAMFQSEKIIIHKMYSHSIRLIKTLAQNFIKPELISENIHQISFSNPNNFLPESEIFVGTECENFIKSFPEAVLSSFKTTCLKFYIKAAEEITKRLPITNQFFKEFEFLDQNVCFDRMQRNRVNDLKLITETFQRFIDKHKVIEEWREIPYFYNEDQISNLKLLTIPEMWQQISTEKDFISNNFKFPNICTLAKLVLSLPHSNASAERIFSVVNDIKTKKRNRIGDNTLNAVTVIRSSFQDKKQTSADFKVTNDHITLHNQSMYSTKE